MRRYRGYDFANVTCMWYNSVEIDSYIRYIIPANIWNSATGNKPIHLNQPTERASIENMEKRIIL